jgi:hypothetical protein
MALKKSLFVIIGKCVIDFLRAEKTPTVEPEMLRATVNL